MLTQRSANPRLQFDELKGAAAQSQSPVGSELLVTDWDRKLLLAPLPQPPYLQPHLWGLRVVPSCVTAALQMTRQRPLFFDQIVESTRIIFGSRLSMVRKCAAFVLPAIDEGTQAALRSNCLFFGPIP